MSQDQFDLGTALVALRRRWWLPLAAAVIAAALAVAVSLAQPERYKAEASLLFREPDPPPRVDPSEPAPEANQAPERTAATNLALASVDQVAFRVKNELRTPLSAREVRNRVDIAPAGQADIVTITATGDSPQQAVLLANAFAGEVVELRSASAKQKVQQVIDAISAQLAAAPEGAGANELRRRARQLTIEKRLRNGDVEVAERAIPPRAASSPKPLRNGLIGGGLVLLLVVLAALVLWRFDRRVESDEEVPEIVGSPVLARIPVRKETGWERELYDEAFQFLRANLELRDPDRHQRVIAVTSPLPGDGKSTVVMGLAQALAVSGSRVIVVDCDLRRPSLHETYGVSGDQGVTSALVITDKDPVRLLKQTSYPLVRLLAAGSRLPVPASVMAATRSMKTLLDRLRRAADYVLVDTSPITIGADASSIAAAVDATIVVVDAAQARRDELEAAMQQLGTVRAKVTGVVLNRAGVLLEEEAYRGYYGVSGNPGTGIEPVQSDGGDNGARASLSSEAARGESDQR